MGIKKSKYVLTLIFVYMLLLDFSLLAKTDSILRVWHTENNPKTIEVLEEIARNFINNHPEVQVKFEAIKWNNLGTKLTKAIHSRTLPDISHIQPFMGASLYKEGHLAPLNDVVESIGRDEIFEYVRDVLYFDKNHYGIPHAMGTTLIIYRKDLFQKKQLEEPKTWAEFLQMIKNLEEDRNKDGKKDFFGIDLPGGENHFMNCVFSALVSSNRGRFFDKNFNPTLNEKPVIEALEFFKNLSRFSLPGWTKRSYMETLNSLATDKVACVYFGSPRLINYIEEFAPPGMRSPDVFAVLPDPHGPSGDIGYSQLDCENWVIFQTSKHKKEAKEFLRFFYKRSNYLKYCLSVPIHLVPVIKSLSEDPEYLQNPVIDKWYSWYKHIIKNIKNGTCYPITLIAEKDDILVPFILQFAEAGIVRNMMIDVAVDRLCPEDASIRAQSEGKTLLRNLNFK